MLHCVHLLMGDRHAQAEGWLDTDALLAIQNELPGVGLKLHVTPTSDEEQYVEQVIQDALRSQQPEGFVLMRSTLTTQRLIAASGLQAVLFGHPYASVKGLPFVDRDQRQIGRLLAEYVVGRGHRRIVMLMRDRLLPGDLEMIDGVREVLNAAGLPADSLVLRCIPHDSEEARVEVSQLLDGCDKLPGILIRSPLIADAAIEAIESLGLAPQQDVAVGVSDYFQNPPGGPPYAVIRPALEADQQGARLGRVVAQLARGETIDPKHRLSPVVLQLPEGIDPQPPLHLGEGRGEGPSACDTRT